MRFIMGTVRPISFFAWIPVIVGAALAGKLGWGLFYGSLGAVLSVGFANAFNNVIDRFQDRRNPAKKTLAVEKPVQAYYVVLFLLPAIAATLRQVGYNNVLLSCLFYTCFWYSYLLGRIPYLKRLTVAGVVATTSFLLAERYPPSLWMWALSIGSYIFLRETRKDHEDMAEDKEFRFATPKSLDWWCVTAPLLAALIFLLCVSLARGRLELSDSMIALGLATTVWSYVQIRSVYGEYLTRFTHRTPAGRMGIVVALVGLMPSFTTTPLLIIVWANSASILYRSFLGQKAARTISAVTHDALLWASVPLIALFKAGTFRPEPCWLSIILFLFAFVRQGYRFGLLRPA